MTVPISGGSGGEARDGWTAMIDPSGGASLIVAAPRFRRRQDDVTLGLLRAPSPSRSPCAALQCGPDYIDPAFHEVAAGRPSYNLDSWAMGAGLIATLAATASIDTELSVAEGVMGLCRRRRGARAIGVRNHR